ncbi:putative calcium-transporting ATPase 13, plasma membrane-type protein, partial [Tanacetum coccineum]
SNLDDQTSIMSTSNKNKETRKMGLIPLMNLICLILRPNTSIGGVPLIPVQQLWANLVINTFGAQALATEWQAQELMQKPPENNEAPLITNVMWRNLLAQSVYQIVVLLIIEFRGKSIFMVDESVKNTIIFNTFVLCQVFNLFNSRKLEKKNIFEDLHKNRHFLGIIGVIIILQVVMVEFLNNFADTEKLNTVQWGVCIAIAALEWPIGWFVRFIPVPNTPFLSYIKLWV